MLVSDTVLTFLWPVQCRPGLNAGFQEIKSGSLQLCGCAELFSESRGRPGRSASCGGAMSSAMEARLVDSPFSFASHELETSYALLVAGVFCITSKSYYLLNMALSGLFLLKLLNKQVSEDTKLAMALTVISFALSLGLLVVHRWQPSVTSKYVQQLNFAFRLFKVWQGIALRSTVNSNVPVGRGLLVWIIRRSNIMVFIMLSIGQPLHFWPNLISLLLMLIMMSVADGHFCTSLLDTRMLNERLASLLNAAPTLMWVKVFARGGLGAHHTSAGLKQSVWQSVADANPSNSIALLTQELGNLEAEPICEGCSGSVMLPKLLTDVLVECGPLLTHLQVWTAVLIFGGSILSEIFRRRAFLRGRLHLFNEDLAQKALGWPISDPRGIDTCAAVAVCFLWGALIVWQGAMLKYLL
eukprot:jgi/Botrbrau1/18853/Bobra.177_2s0015.1